MKLKDMTLRITKGTTPNSSSYGKNEVTYIKSESLNYNGIIDESKFTTIDYETHNTKLKRSILQKNDILYSIAGMNLGKVGIVDSKYLPANTNQAVAIITVNDDFIIPKYLYYYLQQQKIVSFVNSGVSQSAQPNINLAQIGNFDIELPSKGIQERIVKILDNITNRINLNNKINNNLHDLAEQQFNEIYLKGSPKKLGELLVNISTGSRPKGGAQDCGVPSIGAEKIEKFGVYNYSSEKYISEEYYEKLKNGKLNSGDVLLYKDGAYTGKVSMCLNDFPHKKAAVNEHVFILNTKNNWAQNYLYFTLYNKDNKEMIHRLACSKAAQPGLNQIELKSVEVNICDEKEIINFENSVKPIMEKISSNTLENKKLVELRDTLLPKLMNGEIDLDNIEI